MYIYIYAAIYIYTYIYVYIYVDIINQTNYAFRVSSSIIHCFSTRLPAVGPAEGGPPARQRIEAGQQPGDGPKPLGGDPGATMGETMAALWVINVVNSD